MDIAVSLLYDIYLKSGAYSGDVRAAVPVATKCVFVVSLVGQQGLWKNSSKSEMSIMVGL